VEGDDFQFLGCVCLCFLVPFAFARALLARLCFSEFSEFPDPTKPPRSLPAPNEPQPSSNRQQLQQNNKRKKTKQKAVQCAEGGADLFIGYGGVAQRAAVAAGADWYVLSHAELSRALTRYRVAMVGAGAWASAAARLLAQNTAGERDAADRFVDEIRMWVYDGQELCDAINATHENPVYLPGVGLGPNVVAGAFLFLFGIFVGGTHAGETQKIKRSPPFFFFFAPFLSSARPPPTPPKYPAPPHPPHPPQTQNPHPPPTPPPQTQHKTPTSSRPPRTPTCSSSACRTSSSAPP